MFACFLLGSLLAYGLVTVIYRLHIHPLRKFPGPPLAAVTGLYEIYFAAWGAGSFDDEIDRMHEEYGPVVRITPDEIHVQEQFYNSNYADCWIKGTKALDARRHRSGCTTPRSLIRKRSISRVRSILQLEVHQIIRGLVQKHQVHRVLSARFRPFVPVAGLQEIRVDSLEESDLEDGHPSAVRRSMPKLQRSHRLLQPSDGGDAELPVSQNQWPGTGPENESSQSPILSKVSGRERLGVWGAGELLESSKDTLIDHSPRRGSLDWHNRVTNGEQ